MDIHEFRPREPDLEQLASRPAAAWGGEQGSPEVLRELDPSRDRIVSYVGKLIVSKGVDLLLAAWPLVVAACRTRGSWSSGSAPTTTRWCGFVEALATRDLEALEGHRRPRPRARGRARRASSAT